MADNNLDDFFAKRDKKKKSGKKKYETTEELAKILEKRAEERKKLEEGKSQYVSEDGSALPAPKEDDEWLEHKEKEIDYTGLKVSELVLPDEEETEEQERRESEGGGVVDGPWTGRKRTEKPPAAVEEAPAPESSTEEPTGPAESITNDAAETEETSASVPAPATVEATPSTDAVQPAEPAAPTPGKYISPAVLARMRQQEAQQGGARIAGLPPAPPTAFGLANRPAGESTAFGLANRPAGESVEAKGAYVPPSRRAGATPTGATKPRKPTIAPSINDQESFPSLGAS